MTRTILGETRYQTSAVYAFDDGSVVWVCFKSQTATTAEPYANARGVAQRFLDTLDPKERWEGKIDAEGKIIEADIFYLA